MTGKLKDFFDEGVVRSIARDLGAAAPGLDERALVRDGLAGLEELELLPRGWHLAEAMYRHLPRPFPRAAEVLIASLPPPRPPDRERDDGEPAMAPFRFLPHACFIQKYGIDHFEPAMRAQYELTQRFTAEFSIRPYLERYPEAALARLRTWATDPSPHVRRLVSEGTRPRLPWAPRLRALQEDPRPALALLELLKDDPERYVQRSVANHLNDISKDHPELAVEVCRRWLDGAAPRPEAAEGRAWIVGHALRSLVKQGHRGALAALGAGAHPDVAIAGAKLAAASVRVGGEQRFSFELASTARAVQDLVVDYAVHFVKANGQARPKVFKLRRLTLPPAGRVTLGGKISFQPMTTRQHYPGEHRIEVLVNGVAHPLASFDLHA